MQQGCALGVALMIVCSSVGGATAEETKPTNAIRVVEATYGGNCMGVAKGNVTKFVASTCDGTDLCNYRVYYKNMGGDDGEANHFCLLHCLTEGSHERRKAKPKEEKTRRAVDRSPLTAPAVTPNTQSPSSPWQWR
jgi:hypothetical protein